MVSASGVRQNALAIYILFQIPFITGYYKIQNTVLCSRPLLFTYVMYSNVYLLIPNF